MALSDSLAQVGQYIYDQFLTNQTALGIAAVFYGDQIKIPVTPTVCVESDNKTYELAGIPRAMRVELFTYILVYHAAVKDTQVTRKECEAFTEEIITFLNAAERYSMGGLVTHNNVRTAEFGYARRSGILMQTTRISHVALSKVLLPSPAF